MPATNFNGRLAQRLYKLFMFKLFKPAISLLVGLFFLWPLQPVLALNSNIASSNASPAAYKIAKAVSTSFCDAVEDGLPVREAIDYSLDKSKWLVLGTLIMGTFSHEKAEETATPTGLEDTTPLIEKISGKCLDAKGKKDLHAYAEELGAPS